MRRYAVGDIHGCSKALRTLIETIDPSAEDEVVFLGDYIDRGPDSRGVVDQLIELESVCQVVALRGNHEIMLLGVAVGGRDASMWLGSGGEATLTSYGGSLAKIPPRHLEFYQSLRPYYETSRAIFVHANYEHDCPISHQDESSSYWAHLSFPLPEPHASGKRVFVGHTPQASGEVLDAGHLVCLDTYCFGGGYLTAMELDSGRTIQVDRFGHLRRNRGGDLVAWMIRAGKAVWGRSTRRRRDAADAPSAAPMPEGP